MLVVYRHDSVSLLDLLEEAKGRNLSERRITVGRLTTVAPGIRSWMVELCKEAKPSYACLRAMGLSDEACSYIAKRSVKKGRANETLDASFSTWEEMFGTHSLTSHPVADLYSSHKELSAHSLVTRKLGDRFEDEAKAGLV